MTDHQHSSSCSHGAAEPSPIVSNEDTAPYFVPTRRIITENDHTIFSTSQTKDTIVDFVVLLNDSVRGKTNDEEVFVSPAVESILKLLDAIDTLVDKHPPADTVSSRFGKPEFRDFYDELVSEASTLLQTYLLGPNLPGEQVATNHKGAIVELQAYLVESWGNRTRIDYGSGHELNFMTFLLALDILGIVKATPAKQSEPATPAPSLSLVTKSTWSATDPQQADAPALVLKVFLKYLSVMRKIQTVYWLEPAGSHGVWGLDDYHFLPFMFGSSQLATHKHLRPISIHDPEIVEMYAPKYMYLACIKFINDVKTASLRWHSPMLDDISGVKRWAKVNEGMIKMYKAEVLGKLPIMQHFMFGHIVQAPAGVSPAPIPGQELPHVHSNWADCCGIKVPSAIAASQAEHQKQHLRPVGMIPFD